ncbi:VWA domain-containing protein [Stappia sp. F7233]|uniref:VWA domain-containing protein n=1 Tax=Stappia albiluteola TaxID=2758565 RepID=A0A839AEH9_9HYPH|nr:VWA domain-containing protein [Stappia albiluteola]MBA5777981.1 VWA domain-containing protein [Stappia albiluteola]
MPDRKDITDRPEQQVKGEESSSSSDIAAFLEAAKAIPKTTGLGRLVIGLDATMSRQPTWDRACQLQAEMFEAAGRVGQLAMQLVYFRGFGECAASKWVTKADDLARMMSRIDCRGGHTQIGKVLRHTLEETRRAKVQALVYIGDCMEEDVDLLCARAGELGLLGVPGFFFQEGRDSHAEKAFREMARLTKGAYFRFDSASARELAELLKATAVYASGGLTALENLTRSGDSGARLLLQHLR